jgi:hypothetical protein
MCIAMLGFHPNLRSMASAVWREIESGAPAVFFVRQLTGVTRRQSSHDDKYPRLLAISA